jgi:transcription initiation factor IIE alpha subunit
MDILFTCEACGKHCCVGDRAVGKQFPCPDCGKSVQAPEPALVFPCPHCKTSFSAPDALGGSGFLCPACEEHFDIPVTSILVCTACGVNMELDEAFYAELERRRLECPECGESLPVLPRPRIKKAGRAHPPGFGHKTLRLDTILESIPQADQLREGICPFCGHVVEQYNDKSYTCSHCSRQITMTAPTIKRGEVLGE